MEYSCQSVESTATCRGRQYTILYARYNSVEYGILQCDVV